MDDIPIVRDNPAVFSPDFLSIFGSDYWGPGEGSGLYRPLTILSLAMNKMLFGHVPLGYWGVNVALHALVSLLLYFYAKSLGVSRQASWFAAALFAVHPIHAEAVNELVGRSELLVAAFVLFGLWLARRQGRYYVVGVGICFLLALLSKENGILMLGLLPLVDLFFERNVIGILRKRLPLYGLLLVVAVAWFLLRAHLGIHPPNLVNDGGYDAYFVPLSTLDYPHRVLMAVKVQLLYLGNLMFPIHLRGMYPPSLVLPPHGLFSAWGLWSVIVLSLFVFLGYRGWRRRHLSGLAIVLYAVSFAATSNILVLSAVTMADRLAYLPSVWFCLGGVASLEAALEKWERSRLMPVVAGAALVVFAGLGLVRGWDFRTPEHLWRKDLAIDGKNELSQLFLAEELWRMGRLDESAMQLKELVARAPAFSMAHSAYAGVLSDLGSYEEAAIYAKKAIKSSRGRDQVASLRLAKAYIETGRGEEAFAVLSPLHVVCENNPEYWYLFGRVMENRMDLVTALAYYQEALQTRKPIPERDMLRRMSNIQVRFGQYAKAENLLRKDIAFDESAEGWNGLGTLLVLMGRLPEAREAFARAVKINPTAPLYRENLERLQQQNP